MTDVYRPVRSRRLFGVVAVGGTLRADVAEVEPDRVAAQAPASPMVCGTCSPRRTRSASPR